MHTGLPPGERGPDQRRRARHRPLRRQLHQRSEQRRRRTERHRDGDDNFYENQTETIHVTADGGFDQSDEVGPFDCTQYEGAIVQKCNGSQPVLVATYGNKSLVDSDVALAAGYDKVEAPAGEKQEDLVLDVPDHQPFNASLSTKLEGTFATLEGTPDCVPIATTSTTSTVPVSVISDDDPAPPPAPVASPAPAVAPVTLVRTGTTTWPLAGLGVTLVGLGIAFRLRASRLGRA